MLPYIFIFVVSLLLSVVLTPLARKLGDRLDLVAVPGGRRRHEGRISTLGGIPLFVSFMVGAGLIYWLMPPSGSERLLIRGVLIGLTVVFVGGLIDDWLELSPGWLLLIQFIAAIVAIRADIIVGRFTSPISGVPIDFAAGIAVAFTFFWVMGMLNTVNFLDGLDGLAAGVSLIAALMFAWHSFQLGQQTIAAFPLVLVAALLGFLPYNFAPAKIFLGSAGAYFLGYGLASLSILAPAKIATALLVLAVPILDVAWQISARIRRGQSPFHGDRGHLHFRLADSGLPTQKIVLGYYVVAICFGLVAIFAPSQAKLIILLLLTILVLILFALIVRAADKD